MKPTTVEICVFSGRPNPIWTMDLGDEKKFVDMVHLKGPAISTAAANPGKLGYNGISVNLHGTNSYFINNDLETELFLLDTNKGKVEPVLLGRLHEEIAKKYKATP